jgi:sigma-B regulation protein RsbU (phosphoserine phosphatase)
MAFCISDISGKGIPAALLMANFQANLRTLITGKIPLTEFIEILNRKVGEITKSEKFITLFIATYNYNTRKLTYVNAGHNPSILFNKGEVALLDNGCTILGMFQKLPVVQYGEVQIEPGTMVVNYTDGLSEATNSEGQLFEIEGLVNYITQNHELGLDEFNTRLIEHVIEYKQGTDFDDDITLLSIRFK